MMLFGFCLIIECISSSHPYRSQKQMLGSTSCPWTAILVYHLILKAPVTTAADGSHNFSEKIGLKFSSESSARQRIHMKNQALFFSKDKGNK